MKSRRASSALVALAVLATACAADPLPDTTAVPEESTAGFIEASAGGATVRVPTQGMATRPEVQARQVAPSDAALVAPGWATEVVSLYEFEVDRPLLEPAEIRLPIPADAEIALMVHVGEDGTPTPVPFSYDDDMAVATVTEFSFYGFMATTVAALEGWLDDHPWIDTALGGDPASQGPLCPADEPILGTGDTTDASSYVEIVVDDAAATNSITACSHTTASGRVIRVRNDRMMFLDAYPLSGTVLRASPALPWSCCEDGFLLNSGWVAAWDWPENLPNNDTLVVEVAFTEQARYWTVARLVAAVLGYFLVELFPLIEALATSAKVVGLLKETIGDFSAPGALLALANLLTDRVFLARLATVIDAEKLMSKAGIHVGRKTLERWLLIPKAAGDLRLVADILYGGDAYTRATFSLHEGAPVTATTSSPTSPPVVIEPATSAASREPDGEIRDVVPERITASFGADEFEACALIVNEGSATGRFKLFLISDDGDSTLDEEPDLSWFEVPAGGRQPVCLTTNFKFPSINDVGPDFTLVLEEQHQGIVDAFTGPTP